MSFSAPLKALAFVVFIAAVAGAVYGVQVVLGPGAQTVVRADAPHETLNATAGHDVTFPVRVDNRGEAASLVAVLNASGVEGRSAPRNFAADESFTVFVTVRVPPGTPAGELPLDLSVLGPDGGVLRAQRGAVTLNVLAPAEQGFAQGDTAQVTYTGRIADTGEVFNTNDPAYQNLTFPQTGTYRFSAGLLEVRTVPRPTVVQGFYEGMLGMQPGETRTITFGPEKGYGNLTTEERVPRKEVIQRRETLDLPEAPLTTDSFAQFLESTQQGVPEDYEVGEQVTLERQGETLRYRLINKTAEGVVLRLHVEAGERYTIYEFWPNASVVESVNETTATFVTTPTTPEGQGFTYFPHWPEASVVASMDDTEIVVRHDPPVDLKYTQSAGQFQAARSYTVVSVGEDEIVVSTPSSNPLAGKSLTFDVRLVDLRKGNAS